MHATDTLAFPAVWMRGGTSKGLFFRADDLPVERAARERIILAALGSPDTYRRQLDGVGGATSSTSKAVILSPSTRDDCDVDYLFAHVAVDRAVVDWSGNCGNLSAAVGVFAIEQGLVRAGAGPQCAVKVWQANLGQRLVIRVPVTIDGTVVTTGDFAMAGVPGTGARIAVDFLAPADPERGVLPTGAVRDWLDVAGVGRIEASLIAAGNATVFVAPGALGLHGTELPAHINNRPDVLARAEAIRACAAWRMGLVASPAAAASRPATPKLAVVAPPRTYRTTTGETLAQDSMDLCVRIFSMGQLHQAITATGAVAVAVAARIPGTLVADCRATTLGVTTRIGHSAGTMAVDAEVDVSGATPKVARATLYRTARSLMRGEVLVPATAAPEG